MLGRLRSIQIPILTKITIPYAILALFIALGGSYIITNVIIDSVEERFTNQLIETGLLASEGIVRREDALLEDLRLISHIQGMATALNANQVETAAQLALPSAYNSNVEALVLVNRFGRALMAVRLNSESQAYEDFVLDEDWNAIKFVRRVLDGEQDEFGDKFGGLIESDLGTYLFVSGPVQDAEGRVVGAVLVGEGLSSVVRLLREETLAQLSVYRIDGSLEVSTLAEAEAVEGELAAVVLNSQEEGSVSREFVDNAITYNELLSSFEIRGGEDIGLLGVALPTSFLTQTSQITRTNTLIFMTVILFLVIVVGVYVAGIITRPILDLKDAAVQVSEGNLNVRVKSRGRDEVGVLANSFNEMVTSVHQSKQDLLEAYDKTIEGWAKALDLRDHETEGHSRRVTDMAAELAQRLGIAGEELENLQRGALLHDIGKIGIPDSILLKKGSLSDAEYETMKQHPVFGKEFMEQIEFLRPALDIPYCHHEKWDGSGYPQGLAGEEIPLAARIFAVVDVWDAITSDRPYREAMSYAEALKIIEDGRGMHFDPRITDEFIAMLWERMKQV